VTTNTHNLKSIGAEWLTKMMLVLGGQTNECYWHICSSQKQTNRLCGQ